LNPTIPNQYNYTFATSYVFVATPIADTDVVICVITAGIISQKSGIFPYQDITDNITNGNVTIGGRVVNSVNNIKTLNYEGKVSGLITISDGNFLYVTEPDGETINTGIVNQYGYRTYNPGTATTILDPANTFAYVSELPVVTNNIKVKAIPSVFPGSSFQQLQAIYDGSTWGCTISGGLALTGSGATFSAVIDLTLLGISGATVGQAGVVNVDSISGTFTTTPFPYELTIVTQNSTSLIIDLLYSVGTTNIVVVNVAYAITFTATSVS
jgi:hypothetical protein